MQWWFTGEVTWYAPRPIALALVPALAISIFVSMIILSLNGRTRPGQAGLILPALIGIGITVLVIQLLHFWLIEKTLHRNSR